MKRYAFERFIIMLLTIAIVGVLLYLILEMAMVRYWINLPFNLTLEIAWNRFENYFNNVIHHFDFGKSLAGEDVWELVWPKFKLSMIYNLTSLVIFVPVGIFLGVQAAVHKNKVVDVLISTFAMIFNSIPSFVLIFFLVIYVGYEWHWLPPIAPFYSAPLGKQLLGLIIPVFALTAGPIGKFAQLIRGELVEITNKDYFTLLRAKGLTYKRAIYKHGLREAVVAVIPEIIPTFMIMLGFSFIVESTYNIYGVSKLLFDSMIVEGELFNQLMIDTNVVMLIGMLLYIVIMFAALLADISLGLFDPRIKIAGKKNKKMN